MSVPFLLSLLLPAVRHLRAHHFGHLLVHPFHALHGFPFFFAEPSSSASSIALSMSAVAKGRSTLLPPSSNRLSVHGMSRALFLISLSTSSGSNSLNLILLILLRYLRPCLRPVSGS